MSEHIALELTAEQASRIIAADIRAYPKDSPDKLEEHLRRYNGLLSGEAIKASWKARYAELRKEIAGLGARLEAVRPKPKLPVAVGYRRLGAKPAEAKAQSSANASASFSVPATQPPADEKPKDTERQAKPEEEQTEAQGSGSVEDVAKERQLSLTGGTVVIDNAAEMLAAMNERHGVVGNVGGKCRIVEWVPSELDPGVLVPSFQSKTDFINRYAHRQVG
jgi:hypothetical protein